MDELCHEWSPEPLVYTHKVTHQDEQVINLDYPTASSYDYLDTKSEAFIVDATCAAVRNYGVGTCGPAGFYGTLDIHQALQNQIARCLETESALVLAQGIEWFI